MKPVDFRAATFASIQNRIAGSRAAVFAAWKAHGPCTTEQLAERSRLSILSLRPRTTELVDLGFVRLHEEQPAPGAGVYRAREHQEILRWFEEQKRLAGCQELQTALTL